MIGANETAAATMENSTAAATEELKGSLRLVCAKCTKQGTFPAVNRALATLEAQAKGWVFRMRGGELCPKCAGSNKAAAMIS